MGINLFNYQTMATSATGKYLTSDGVENEGSAWNISDYIPCLGKTFTINPIGGNDPSMCLYDSNKNYITGINYSSGSVATKTAVTITANVDAYFIRFSYRANSGYEDDLTQIMLNRGSSSLPFVPYGPSWTLDENEILTNENLTAPIGWQPPYPAGMWVLDDNDILTNSMLPEVLVDTQGAFAGVESLTYIQIPETVKSIGRYSFRDTGLTEVTLAEDCTYYATSFPSTCTVIGGQIIT